jgi:hypothetical protein
LLVVDQPQPEGLFQMRILLNKLQQSADLVDKVRFGIPTALAVQQ